MWLAKLLRPYGIRPKTLWIEEVCGKGYMMDDFKEAFRRYVPRSEALAFKEELAASIKAQGAGRNAAPSEERED